MRRLALPVALACAALSTAAAGAGPKAPFNVLIIGADTLRPDHLGLYGYSRPTSPNLDRLARGAVVFDRAYAQGSFTLPSFASLFTSRYPDQHGAIRHETAVAPGEVMLADVFRRAGYRTAGLTGGPYLSPQYGLAQGFDDYLGGDLPRPMSAYAPAALEWIRKDPRKPFFLFLQPQDVHPPFDLLAVPEAERGRWDPGYKGDVDRYAGSFYYFRAFNGESYEDNGPEPPDAVKKHLAELSRDPAARRRLAALYDDRVASLDRSLGDFFRELDESGVLSRTIVVLLSDHGTLFGEGGKFGHGVHDSTNDGIFHVVLAFWIPGQAPRRVESPVQLIDVAPTLAALAGVPIPPAFEGRDLAPLLAGREDSPPRPVFGMATETQVRDGERRYFVRDGRWKLVLDRPEGGTSLYEPASDPDETRDVSAGHPEAVKRLSRELLRHLERTSRPD